MGVPAQLNRIYPLFPLRTAADSIYPESLSADSQAYDQITPPLQRILRRKNIQQKYYTGILKQEFLSGHLEGSFIFCNSFSNQPIACQVKSLYNTSMNNSLTIIGAGPAGMTAALFAARAGGQVTLIDGNPMVGRKLLVTGSGRANLTNRAVSAARYTCGDPGWMDKVLTAFGHEETLAFLESIGILTFATHDGWCYPLSESAQSVVDAFASALDQAGVQVLLDHKVTAIRNIKGEFQIEFKTQRPRTCETLLVAAGGVAYPTLGSRGQLFPPLKDLGHSVRPLLPALAPVTCEMEPYASLQGVRFDANVRLYEKDKRIAETTGNLIFTAWGLNGPAVMDLSHHISARKGKDLTLRLNPLFASEPALRALLREKRGTPTPLTVLLGAVLPPKMPPVLLPLAGLSPLVRINEVSDAALEKLLRLLTSLPFKVSGVRGFEYCQVSAGGVPVSEVDPLTMRSRLVPELLLAGETLDVVGPCGGYNLQFAFSSGALAGMG
jgi:predicted Rossmann fold flavoprotein